MTHQRGPHFPIRSHSKSTASKEKQTLKSIKLQARLDHTRYLIESLFETQSLHTPTDYTLTYVPLITLDGYLFTFEGGFNNPQKLLLIHGFGTTLAFWYKLIPYLIKHFHVYAFDLYGMGCSYNYKFDITTFDDALS